MAAIRGASVASRSWERQRRRRTGVYDTAGEWDMIEMAMGYMFNQLPQINPQPLSFTII